MQHRTFVDRRKPQLTASASFRHRQKLRMVCGAIAAALTATVALRA